MAIKSGLSKIVGVSRPFFSFDFIIVFEVFPPFSGMKLLHMMSTVILCNVICDCLYFRDK